MKVYRFILNPKAGNGKAPLLEKMIREYRLSSEKHFEIKFTEYTGHAAILAAEAVKENCYAVIAVGGDGTVNEVAGALVNTNTLLGILPMGSGNGLARHLGYTMNPAKAIAQIINAGAGQMDTLQINDRLSVNVSGMGFDGYVAWLFNTSGKRGLSTYTAVALKAYNAYKSATFEFRSEEHSLTREAHMLVIANASQFGNKAIIAPGASVDDGFMECVFVHKPPFYRLPGLFLRLFSGKIKDTDYLQTIKCRSFTVTTSRPLHVHLDGESIEPVSEVRVEILPRSLKILKVA
jgi:YegS/Rv2252/BmrU family lipid kinase